MTALPIRIIEACKINSNICEIGISLDSLGILQPFLEPQHLELLRRHHVAKERAYLIELELFWSSTETEIESHRGAGQIDLMSRKRMSNLTHDGTDNQTSTGIERNNKQRHVWRERAERKAARKKARETGNTRPQRETTKENQSEWEMLRSIARAFLLIDRHKLNRCSLSLKRSEWKRKRRETYSGHCGTGTLWHLQGSIDTSCQLDETEGGSGKGGTMGKSFV